MTSNTTATASTLEGDFTKHRAALVAHCYQMTGSYQDAEDLVQETYLRAARGYSAFEGRSSVKTWLYRIATNTCITALGHRSRRVLPSGLGAPSADPDSPIIDDESVSWMQPLPDAVLDLSHGDPAELAVVRESVRLALVAALQVLPPRQRAAFLLREVLSWPATEIADTLGVTIPAVKGLLQRARTRLAEVDLADRASRPLEDEAERALLDRYVAAFQDADPAKIKDVIHDDFALESVPHATWFQGIGTCLPFLEQRGFEPAGKAHLMSTRANGQPAFGLYRLDDGGAFVASALVVLTTRGNRFARSTSFPGADLVEAAGLPRLLEFR